MKHEGKRLEQGLFRVIANNTGVGAKTGFDIFLGDICSEDAETRTGLVKTESKQFRFLNMILRQFYIYVP